MVQDELIGRAAAGEMEALSELDAQGFLMGGGETSALFAARLTCLRDNVARLESELATTGSYRVEGITVHAGRRIPQTMFAEARDVTEPLYRFAMDWVPGFFINPRFSLLFGGCAFYFMPDFFVLFIIRRSFERRSRWLIYSRRELLSHELCHVARIGLGSVTFEETFAYQTAASRFRRYAGSVFQRPLESFCFLGSAFALLAAQLARTLAVPRLPMWPFWALLAGMLTFLLVRHAGFRGVYRRALQRAAWVAPDAAPALLFRCTDSEVARLAGISSAAEAQAWVEARCAEETRWRVIRHRFIAAVPAAAVP